MWEESFNEKVLPYLIENNFKVIVESDDGIDIHSEEYKDFEFEVVDYLCYALPDEDDESWCSYYLKLVGDNNISLKKVY